MFLALIVYITMVLLPALKGAGAFFMIVSCVFFGVLAFITLVAGTTGDEGKPLYVMKTVAKSGYFKLVLAIIALGFFTPNEKVTWYMVGAYAAEQVVTSETTKEIAGETKDMFLDLIKKARENINAADAAELAKKAGASLAEEMKESAKTEAKGAKGEKA